MKAEDILDAIGQAEDACIRRARTPVAKKPRRWWIAVGAVAACLLLCVPVMSVFVAMKRANSSGMEGMDAAPEQNGVAGEDGDDDGLRYPESNDDALAYEEVTVYYVHDGRLESGVKTLPLAPQEVFAVWREANGIGDEVTLLRVHIEDNSTTVDNGETVEHTVGDYFILHIRVSANLADYYPAMGESLLTEALKRTMAGYSGIEFDEVHLYLE